MQSVICAEEIISNWKWLLGAPATMLSIILIATTTTCKFHLNFYLYNTNISSKYLQFSFLHSEVQAYVDSVQGRKIVGKHKKLNLFKFSINNGTGKRIQCLAWEGEVNRVAQVVAMDKVRNFIVTCFFFMRNEYRVAKSCIIIIIISKNDLKILK